MEFLYRAYVVIVSLSKQIIHGTGKTYVTGYL